MNKYIIIGAFLMGALQTSVQATSVAAAATLVKIYAAGAWTVKQYKEGAHCKALCTQYSCGRGAVKEEGKAAQGVFGAIYKSVAGSPDLKEGNLVKSNKSLGSFCKKTCQWKEKFTVNGTRYELKKRFDTQHNWNIQECVKAFNEEIVDGGGTSSGSTTSLAVYNQADYDRIHAAIQAEDHAILGAYLIANTDTQ